MISPEDGAGEAHTEVDAHTVVTHDAVEVGFVLGELEVGEKAEGTKGEGEDWGNNTLEEPGGVEDGTVAAKGEDEVESLRGSPAKVWRPVL